jgi:hypothetical protein
VNCVLCSPRRPRLARDGGVTCWRCLDNVEALIVEVAQRYTKLDARPTSSISSGRRAPGFASKPPLVMHIAALRDPRTVPESLGDLHNAYAFLGGWLNRVREARDQSPVRPQGFVASAQYLIANLDWISRQPWIAAFHGELKVVISQLRAATGEPNPRPMASCARPILDEGGEFVDWCNAPLFPPARDENVVRCPDCDEVYNPLDLLQVFVLNNNGPEVGPPCAHCLHSESQHDNDAAGARPCLVQWCSCTAHRTSAA